MAETTVIIPTYNRLPFLREAVDSVLKQSYRDFELLIVDDGSTDATRAYAQSLGGSVRYFYKENGGPGSARNFGIGRATGCFIAFLDSDDLWLPQKLAVQVSYMKARADALVCYTDEIWIRRGVRVNPKRKHRKHTGWIFEHCLPLCIVSPSSVLMRRPFFELVGLFDESLPAGEDYDLWLRAALKLPFHFIPQKLITKRGGHTDQLSAGWGLDRYRVQALFKLLKQEELSPQQTQLTVRKIVEKCGILAHGCRKRGKEQEAEFYARLAEVARGYLSC